MNYFNINDILSHNCMINIVQCGRGVGKTYSTLKWCLKDYINKGHKFIYLRRYKNEIKETMRENPLKAIMNEPIFKNYTTATRGAIIYCAPTVDLTDQKTGEMKTGKIFNEKYKCAQCIALSTSSEIKSSDFSDYDKLVFEEFAISGQYNHYLRDEVIIFLELLETVFRHRKMRVVMLGNTVTRSNPYFTYFHITNPNMNGITKYYVGKGKNRKKDILLYNASDEDFKKYKRNTDIGRLIEGTEYGEYAIENKALIDNHIRNIEKKSTKARFIYSFLYNGKEIGFWIDSSIGKLYASYKVPKDTHKQYSITREDQSINAMLIYSMKRVNDIQILRDAVTYNFLYYESESLFDLMSEIIDLMKLY